MVICPNHSDQVTNYLRHNLSISQAHPAKFAVDQMKCDRCSLILRQSHFDPLLDQIKGMTANLKFFRIKSADFTVKRIFKQHTVLKPSQCKIDMVGQRKINVLVKLHGKMTLRIGNNLI